MKNNDFDLEEMRRLWQKQSRALEGQPLVSEDEVRRAIQGSPKAEVRQLHVWRRVAAVAVVVLVAGVTLWHWPEATPGSKGVPVAGLRTDRLPADTCPAAESALAPQPVATMNSVQKPVLVAKAVPQVPPTEEYAAEVPQYPSAEPTAPTEASSPILLARAEMPRQSAWPNRNRHVDTIVVETNRLVHFEAPMRKSLTETIFEPLLASL